MQVKERYNEYIKLINEHLDKFLPVKYPESIYNSMRYSLLAGGKRLRPVFCLEIARISNCAFEKVLPLACAIEMLHCQSLIHDDLPAMDNDDYRRGKLTNHKVYGDAVAILAGDAFLSYAPKLIIDKTPSSVSSDVLLKVLNEFFIAAGTDGIISGQIVDLDSEKKKIDLNTLEYLYEYKTSKLFKLAIRAAAIISGVSNDIIEKLTQFAQLYGYAFQIRDDILDVTTTIDELGKTPNKDILAEKSTYVSMFGLQKSKERVMFLSKNACDILKLTGYDSELLLYIVNQLSEGF